MAYDASGNWDPNGQYDGQGNPVNTPGGGGLNEAAGAPQAAAASTPAPAPLDTSNVPAPGNDANQVQGWYSQFLGRNASPAELNQQLTAAPLNGGLGTVQNVIANSPEAMAYAKANGFGQPNPTAPAAAPAAASAGSAAPAVSNGSSAFQLQIRQMLMDQLAKAGQPVDPNSPEIAATMSASSDAGVRASDAERTALAERLYAQGGGLNTNALTQQIQQSGEKQAANQSNLKASLLTNEYNQKLQQMNQLMSLAVQSGDAESARNIQAQIANLQAAVQREGLGVNLAEFGANLNQNAALYGLNG